MAEMNNIDTMILIERMNASAEAQAMSAKAFAQILEKMDGEKITLQSIYSLSERDHDKLMEYFKAHESYLSDSRSEFKTILEILKSEAIKNQQTTNKIDGISNQVTALYDARIGQKQTWKQVGFYVGAIATLLVLLQALIQLGLLHLTWGGH